MASYTDMSTAAPITAMAKTKSDEIELGRKIVNITIKAPTKKNSIRDLERNGQSPKSDNILKKPLCRQHNPPVPPGSILIQVAS